MNNYNILIKIMLNAAFALIASFNANAATINFSGQLGVIEPVSTGGAYFGTPVGTTFSGFVDDITASGEITNGISLTTFSCCIAAGGLSVSNDFVINAEDALLFNTLSGTSLFSDGDILDGINIEGDAATFGDGRIEIGVSYIFDGATFSNSSLDNYPFNANDALLSLFFITEEDSGGEIIYSAVGKLDAVPLPASAWLFISGFISLFSLVKINKQNKK